MIKNKRYWEEQLGMELNDNLTLHEVKLLAASKGVALENVVKDLSNEYDVVEVLLNNGHCIDQLYTSDNKYIRKMVAEHGYHLEELKMDKSKLVTDAVFEHGYDYPYFAKYGTVRQKISLAYRGICIDILAEDPNTSVKVVIIREHHSHLEKLSNDPSRLVRMAVAAAGYKPEHMVHDKDIRVIVAAIHNMEYDNRHYLEELAYHKSSVIRDAARHQINKIRMNENYNNIFIRPDDPFDDELTRINKAFCRELFY